MSPQTPANGPQQSSSQVYNAAILELNAASAHIMKVRSNVTNLQASIQRSYQGQDGMAFDRIIETWLQTVDTIRKTTDEMAQTIGTNRNAAGSAQEDAMSMVNGMGGGGGSTAGDNVFAAMTR